MKPINKMNLAELADYLEFYEGTPNDPIASRLRELHEFTRWIPVSERMPEDAGQLVRIWHKASHEDCVLSGEKTDWYDPETKTWSTYGFLNITHWSHITSPEDSI